MPESINSADIEKLIAKLREPKMIKKLTDLASIFELSPDYDMAKKFIDTAKKDLIASKTLYLNGDYSNSTFHLQQAIEKIAKAYALQIGFLSIKEIKGVGHETPEVFLRLLKRKKFVRPLIDLVNQISPTTIDINKLNEINRISKKLRDKKTKVEVAKYSKEQIENILKLCKNIKESFIKMKELFIIIIPSIQSKVKQNLLNELKSFVPKIKPENVDEIIKTLKPEFFDFIANFLIMFVLAIITYPHASFTRYPNGTIKSEDYAPGLGIVDMMPQLHNMVEDIINK
ncbi:MAG: HEPN domain-containing protein [Nitrososphaeria archaeon]